MPKNYLKALKIINKEEEKRAIDAHEAVEKFSQIVEPIKYGVTSETKPEQNYKNYNDINEISEQKEDCFSKLENAFINLQQIITEFVTEQVENQVNEVKKENQELKTYINEIMPKYEALKGEAVKSNWVGVLRAKFGKVETE